MLFLDFFKKLGEQVPEIFILSKTSPKGEEYSTGFRAEKYYETSYFLTNKKFMPSLSNMTIETFTKMLEEQESSDSIFFRRMDLTYCRFHDKEAKSVAPIQYIGMFTICEKTLPEQKNTIDNIHGNLLRKVTDCTVSHTSPEQLTTLFEDYSRSNNTITNFYREVFDISMLHECIAKIRLIFYENAPETQKTNDVQRQENHII